MKKQFGCNFTLGSEYCKNINSKWYQITTTILDAAISKIQNSKAPGIDRITGFWYKSLHSYCHELALLFNKAFSGLTDIPESLARALTRPLPKNDETENKKKLPTDRMLKYNVETVY